MTEAQAIEAIGAAFVAGWTTKHPEFEIVLGNEANSTADRWVRLSVPDSIRDQVSMGNRRYEISGFIALQIFVPTNGGDKELRVCADDARAILEGTSLPQRDGAGNPIAGGDAVETFGGPTSKVGTDAKWYYCTIPVRFTYWEMR